MDFRSWYKMASFHPNASNQASNERGMNSEVDDSFIQQKLNESVVSSDRSSQSSTCIIKVAVGSNNPVKTEAAKCGVRRAIAASILPGKDFDIQVYQYDVSSGISVQPMGKFAITERTYQSSHNFDFLGDEETLQGGINRARNAYNAHYQAHHEFPDFAVGLEGGVAPSVINTEELECFAWIVIFNGKSFGRARTASFLLPSAIRDMIILENMELGEADDRLFKTINSKQKKINGSTSWLLYSSD